MFEKYPKHVQKLPNMLSVFPHDVHTIKKYPNVWKVAQKCKKLPNVFSTFPRATLAEEELHYFRFRCMPKIDFLRQIGICDDQEQIYEGSTMSSNLENKSTELGRVGNLTAYFILPVKL